MHWKAIALSVVRHSLTAVGGALVASGNGDVGTLGGVAIALIGLAASIIDKKKRAS